MMWDVVVKAWLDTLEADAALLSLLGGRRIYPAQSARAVEVPSLEWSLVWDREDELFNPFVVQVDLFARLPHAAPIERRVRLLTHRDTSRTLGGHRMWTRFTDSRSHPYPADRSVLHRSLDFEFRPLRSKYANL